MLLGLVLEAYLVYDLCLVVTCLSQPAASSIFQWRFLYEPSRTENARVIKEASTWVKSM
jgi:hypothetical protein